MSAPPTALERASRSEPVRLRSASDEVRGVWLGCLGVVIFAMTLPMTRLAVGPVSDPQLSPLFLTAGRAALAGFLSLVWLAVVGAPRPRPALLLPLALSALGTVVGFPLFLSLALRRVDAMHAAVVSGLVPMATAIAASLWFRQRASVPFWCCAALGSALVLGFAAWRGSGTLGTGDGYLLLAVLSTAIGYVAGARVAAELPGEQVICWVLLLSLPLTAPVALAVWPVAPVRATAWGGFAYVALFSMWLGFFAWYRALAIGGALRVSQVQLLQPFLALLFAVPVLGERLDPVTVLFALAVVGVVFVGRRLPAGPPAGRPRPPALVA